MKTALLVTTGLMWVSTGCSAIGRSEPNPEIRMQAGLDALAQNDIARAQEHFQWVYNNQPGKQIGYEALLAFIATELDPRNPDRQLYTSSELAERLIRAPDAPPWMRPLGNTFYLLALELGAHDERMAQSRMAQDLPQLEKASLAAQLRALRLERDSLEKKSNQLAEQLSKTDKDLKEKSAELERLRKTIRG